MTVFFGGFVVEGATNGACASIGVIVKKTMR
jgi:hypothetical protein